MEHTGEILGINVSAYILVSRTLVVGGIIFLIFYVASRFPRNRQTKHSPDGLEDKEGIKKGSVNTLVTTDGDNSSNNTITSKRTKNKKRREVQQEFTHPWLVGTLKGHTDLVLDIDFSSNNKYLASCAQGKRKINIDSITECVRYP